MPQASSPSTFAALLATLAGQSVDVETVAGGLAHGILGVLEDYVELAGGKRHDFIPIAHITKVTPVER